MPGILYKDLKLCRGTFIGQAIMLIITNSMVLMPYLADRKVYSDDVHFYSAHLFLCRGNAPGDHHII